jgi:Na+(H+)/acetate symporter ActP
MFRSRWVWVIWVIIGLVVAWEHIYITVRFLEGLASALLAVVLWPLVLLGVNLHVH